jgi:hypothetical protein
LKSLLRREYTAVLVMVTGHVGVEISEQWIIPHAEHHRTFWIVLTVAGFSIYGVLRTLKKRTRILDAPGR